MPTIQANGVEYNVEVSGAGPPVLALHGFTGSAATWQPTAEALGASFTVCAIDLLGHGGSSRPDDPARYSMANTIADLRVVMDELGHPAANLLGYSMGGRIALSFALAAPERCGSLALESASPGIADDKERAERVAADEALAKRLETEGIEAFVDYWQSIPLFATQSRLPQAVRDALRAQRLAGDPAGLAASLRGIGAGAQPPVHLGLPSLVVPTMFLVGELDTRYCEIALEMASNASAGQVTLVSEAGHAVHLEQADTFHETLRVFFQQ